MFPYHASPSIPNSIQDLLPIMQLIPVIQHDRHTLHRIDFG